MAVKLEYDDEKNRLELLNEQRDDLIAAEENLRAIAYPIFWTCNLNAMSTGCHSWEANTSWHGTRVMWRALGEF